MLWLSLRQFRTQALVAAVALAALAVLLAFGGSQLLHDYHEAVRSGNLDNFVNQHQSMGEWLSGIVLVVPGLIGIFWGAPLVARELESGTFRLAWTQSVSRTRWVVCKLALLGLAGVAVAGLCSLLVTWWATPLDLAVGSGPFATFDARGIVPVAYAAFAFASGVAVGAVVRKTVGAMGITLALFVAVRVAFTEWVRPHLMVPLTARSPFTIISPRKLQIGGSMPHGSWVASEGVVNSAGHEVTGGVAGLLNISNLSTVTPSGVRIPGVGSCPNLKLPTSDVGDPNATGRLLARCVDQLHLANVVTYQPPNRYWPFQIYESLVFVALALAAGVFTVWWVRRLS